MSTYQRRDAISKAALARQPVDRLERGPAAPAQEGRAPGRVGVGALLVWPVLFWATLNVLVGWAPRFPELPTAWPSWTTIEVWLGSAILPTEWLIPVVGALA